jgi:hypothetical protein
MLKADNLTIILCRCHEIWNLNFLEPSEPLQACNGTALRFTGTRRRYLLFCVIILQNISVLIETYSGTLQLPKEVQHTPNWTLDSPLVSASQGQSPRFEE